MSPQGFGFEPRVKERRSGADRRADDDRRGEDRRTAALPVEEERRRGDRRSEARRLWMQRRVLPDRRNNSFRSSGGLRLTIEDTRRAD